MVGPETPANRGGTHMTEKEALRRQIDAAAGRTKADLVVKNCRIVN